MSVAHEAAQREYAAAVKDTRRPPGAAQKLFLGTILPRKELFLLPAPEHAHSG
ncbi:hypothetical protein [Gordonia jinhuaensis]|uniref:hypothetical protein n=1 Tax=Gordonia jinhuaensis TaxID=1517702 RepID=UPI00166C258D|nr:hypothetical protein [Gordonia jinhuaensis]